MDTHAHLDDEAFDGDRSGVVERAVESGVSVVLSVGVDLASSRRAVEMSTEHPSVEAAIGIHPSHADVFLQEWAGIQTLLTTGHVRAIGEIGLDYFRCRVSAAVQRRAFRAQLATASEVDLPVVVHDREAHEDVLEDLEEFRPRGVLHCFSGGMRMAERAIELGMFVSVAGNITYPKSSSLRDVIRELPEPSLLAETDAPFLSPRRTRGRRNEPANVRDVVEEMARLRQVSFDQAASSTSRNAARLFRWS